MAKRKTEPIVTLVPWAGRNFSVSPGQTVNVPPKVAKARIAAGLASKPPKEPEPATEADLDARQIETASVKPPETATAPKAKAKTAGDAAEKPQASAPKAPARRRSAGRKASAKKTGAKKTTRKAAGKRS